ncbi:MAG TPA: thermopsin family protease, partial [Thermoplasmata archaeon]|nr:thermopsin family protease [Thermoplasmata archaeon]
MRWDRRLSVVAIVTLLVLSMALVAVGLSHPSTPTTAEPTRVAGIPSATLHSPATLRSPPAGYAQKLAREFAASGAPADSFLPPNARFAPGYHNGVLVHPSYTEGPEPVGVADYGVRNTSGTATAYTIDSTGYMGSLTLSQDSEFSLPGTGYPELMTVQLNAVLNDTTVNGISGYQFWTQNVLIYDAYAHTGLILDNLWNFSAYPQGPLTSSDILSGNGTVVPSVGFYYDFGSPLLQLPTPFTVQLYLTTSTVSI